MKWFMLSIKKYAPVIIVFALMIAGGAGITAALLHTRTQAAVNDFQGAQVNIAVYENGEIYEEQTSVNSSYERMKKNEPVMKQVAVKNLELPGEPAADTYVKVRLVPAFVYDAESEYAGQTAPIDMRQVGYTYGEDDHWRVELGEDGENYYYYDQALSPGATTGPLITAVNYSGDIPENVHFELKVLAEGVAAKQENCLSAWNLKDFDELLYLPEN